MDIYQIREATLKSAKYFFAPKTLEFFHQTMEDFTVEEVSPSIYRISQPMCDYDGTPMGTTIRFFCIDKFYGALSDAIKRRDSREEGEKCPF